MRKLLGILAFLLLAGAFWLFLDRSVFLIRDVEVACDQAVDADRVIRASGIELGARMRALDPALVARKTESTGEFAFVAVDKRYPSAVRLTVRLRVPAAMAEAGGLVVLMDKEGCVISATPAAPDADAVYVTGLEVRSYDIGRRIAANEDRLSAMREVISALDGAGARGHVSELNVADVNALYIYSRTGILVILGDEGEMEEKIVLMKCVLEDLESRGETSGRLDVSSGDKADFSGS